MKMKRKKETSVLELSRRHSLEFKGDDTGYGYIARCLGDSRFDVVCEDTVHRVGVLRGSLRNKVWVTKGNVVLYSNRSFQASKVDVLHVYTYSDVMELHRLGELPIDLYRLFACGEDSDLCHADVQSNVERFVEFVDGDA
jgi:initiation factor 1A